MITFILYEYILFQYINYTSLFLFLAYSYLPIFNL